MTEPTAARRATVADLGRRQRASSGSEVGKPTSVTCRKPLITRRGDLNSGEDPQPAGRGTVTAARFSCGKRDEGSPVGTGRVAARGHRGAEGAVGQPLDVAIEPGAARRIPGVVLGDGDAAGDVLEDRVRRTGSGGEPSAAWLHAGSVDATCAVRASAYSLAAMTVVTRWPMVGRGLELDAFTAALRDPGCEGLCIYGPPGVGKTRLGDECLMVAEADGRRVMRATGEASMSAVPFAGIAHLLPARALVALSDGGGAAGEVVVRARMLNAARRALDVAPGETGAPVLFLDDAHRLDDSSLSLLDDLMAEHTLVCISTVVAGETVPELVTRWWRDERATRIDLAPLDPVAVDTLLHVVLEGPLHEAASHELWRASRGNMLALRELVLGASARGQLVSHDGTWRLIGELAPPARLREVIEARFSGLAPAALDVLERLALCQPLALSRLEAAAGLAALEDLERDGLITVQNDGRRESVRLAHPLHGEVLRAGLPRLRARSILLEEAEAIEACGARRREDPLRIACWRLEATGRAEPELLVGASRLARFAQDYRRAAMLARAALAAEPSAEAGLVLGEALYNIGSFDDAEAALADATLRARGDTELVRIATVRRRNLFRGCRRDAEALEVGRVATAAVVSDEARTELLIGEAEILAVSGRSMEALALLARTPASSPRLHVLGAIARASGTGHRRTDIRSDQPQQAGVSGPSGAR